MSTNNINRVLKEQKALAFKGIWVYRRLAHRYLFNQADRVIFVPDSNEEDYICSLLFLRDLEMTILPTKLFFVSVKPETRELLPVFSSKAEAIVITPDEMNAIECYYQFRRFTHRVVFASLSRPFGRIGDRLLRNERFCYGEAFAIGVYRVWKYEHPRIPEYTGESDVLIQFLDKARTISEGW